MLVSAVHEVVIVLINREGGGVASQLPPFSKWHECSIRATSEHFNEGVAFRMDGNLKPASFQIFI